MAKEAKLEDIPVAHLVPVQGQLEGEEQEAQGVLKEIDGMTIENQEDLDFAGEILTEVKGKKKHLENERTKATKPIRTGLDVIYGWFRTPIRFYETCEKRLKRKIADYHREQRLRQQAALAEAGKASMRGDAETAREALQVAQAAQVHKVAGVSTKDVLKWKVVDLSLVPREFLTIDPELVDAYIVKHGENSKIPGIELERDVKVTGRAAKTGKTGK